MSNPGLDFYLNVPELTSCRECNAPAEVVERFVLESTDGPVEHAVVRCTSTNRHIPTVVG